MEKDKLGQESAFAKSAYVSNEGSVDPPQEGMSKRFYAACAAMQGLIAAKQSMYMVNSPTNDPMDGFVEPISLCRDAYSFADELLKQENL